MTVVSLDSELSPEAMNAIKAVVGVKRALLVHA
jgi:hypothetical protein